MNEEKDPLEILKNIRPPVTHRSTCLVNQPKSLRLFFKPNARGPDPSRKTRRSNASSPEEFRKNGNDKRATLDDFLTLEIWKMPTEGGEFRSAHTYSPLYGNFIRGTCVPCAFYQKKKKKESFVIKRYSILLENLVVSISRLDIFYLHEKERERERICTVEAVGSRRISYSFTPNRSGNLRQTRQVLKVSGYNEKEEPLHGSIFFEPLTTVTRIIQYISFDPTFDTRKDIQSFLSPIYY